MNIKTNLSFASLVLAAGIGFNAFAFGFNHPALREASPHAPLTLKKALPNPGFKRVATNELQWSPTFKAPAKYPSAAKAPSKAAADIPTLMGCVCYADSWTITGEGKVGIYEIDDKSLSEVSLHKDMLTSYGQVYAGSKYFATQPEVYSGYVVDMIYNIYDTSDWTESQLAGDYNFAARAMAFDPVSRRAYAITINDLDYTYHFSVMDMETYDFHTIRELGYDDWSALMCSADGSVYGIKKDGMLTKFDKSSGKYTEIGQTGLASLKMTCGTVDPASGRCFYVYYTGDVSEMYEIDLATAKPTFLYSIPEHAQILSLFVPEKAISSDAPAKASNLALDFASNSLSGKFSFQIPTTTESGSPLEGEVNYTAMMNGNKISEGKGKAGEIISCQVEVTCSDEYTFSVVLSNAAGENEIAAISAWVGFPKPEAPKNAMLFYDGSGLTVLWDKVTVAEGSNTPVTYSVVAYPGGTKVAEGLTVTNYFCEAPVEEVLTRYYFGIIANYGDSQSEEVLTNSYVTGYLPLPYYEDFEDASCMDLFTIVNSNGDSQAWEYNFFGEGRLMITYSLRNSHDDWAILHPVKLEKGKLYNIGCDAHGTPMYEEKLEIAVAKGTDKESLKNAEVVVPAFTLTDEEYKTYSGAFIPNEDGIYYIGFHALSKPDQNKLFLDNIFVTTGTASKAPGKVDSLTATADASGKLKTYITFTAPVSDMTDQPLEELSYVAIERNGTEIAKLECAAGKQVSYTDESPVNGLNTYTIVGYNTFGRGMESTASVYVGLSEPMPADNITLRYGSNTGEAVVTWTAPTSDIKGNRLEGTELSYNVLRTINGSSLLQVATGLKEPKFIEQAVKQDEDQKFVNYIIEVVGIGGISERAISNIYPLGRPEQTPAKESFGGRTTDFEWGAESTQEGFITWDIYPNNELPFSTFDGGSCAAAYMIYSFGNDKATLISSLFDLSALDTPVLSFYLYDYVDTQNTLKVYVDNGKTCELVSNVELEELDFEWKRKTVDLSAYKGETVCIKFEATLIDYNLLAIDNMRITNDLDHNLSVLSITAPDSAEANEEFNITALVENAGKKNADSYTANLLCDEKILKSVECSDLKAEELETIEFTVSLPVVSGENPQFSIEIDYPLDEASEDNTSEKVAVRFLAPSYPAPRNLSAKVEDNKVVLTWDAPNMNDVVLVPSIDDIEAYTPFSTGLPTTWIDDDNIGDWTTIDVDGLTTYTSEFTYPGVGDPMAFVVYNSHMQEDNVFACHSGQQMFLSLASRPQDDKGNDDWLISPLLAECAQTISFYAKTISADLYGPDTFQVLYSLSGKEISDFVLLKEYTSTGDWKEYTANIPEGAKYFAVRCISYDKFAFLLDDFRMITAKDAVNDLDLTGYNVYCNGKRVNDTLVNETAYTHALSTDESSTLSYNVSCLFNLGESKPSETVKVTINPSAVEEIAASDIVVIGRSGELIVKGAEGKEVIVADSFGRVVYHDVSNGDVSISVPAGIYMVKAGTAKSKVIVR